MTGRKLVAMRAGLYSIAMDGPAPNVAPLLPRALRVADTLREKMLDGGLADGEKINEARLAAELGVSRTPLRTALHALAAEGLLDYAPNRGFTVRDFSAELVDEAFEIRAALEGLACRFAARHGLSPQSRLTAEAALAEGEAVVAGGQCRAQELERYRAANVAFHEAILQAARNRQLADTLRLVLNRPGASLRRIVAFTPLEIRRRVDDHRRILDAIISQDPWRAELLMREHVSGIRGGAGRSGQD